MTETNNLESRVATLERNFPIHTAACTSLIESLRETQVEHGKKLHGLIADVRVLGTKIDAVGCKVDVLDGRVSALDDKVDRLETKVDRLETKVDDGFAKVGSNIAKIAAALTAAGIINSSD